jgi:hypothetical protein
MLHMTCTGSKEKKTKVEKGGVFQKSNHRNIQCFGSALGNLPFNADPDLALPSY